MFSVSILRAEGCIWEQSADCLQAMQVTINIAKIGVWLEAGTTAGQCESMLATELSSHRWGEKLS